MYVKEFDLKLNKTYLNALFHLQVDDKGFYLYDPNSELGWVPMKAEIPAGVSFARTVIFPMTDSRLSCLQ